MSKHNRQTMLILMLILIASAFFIIPQLNTKLLFSISISDLQKNRIPYINHNSKITSTPLGDINIKSESLLFTCKSEIATLSTEQRELFSGGKDIVQTVFVPSWIGTVAVPNPRPECWRISLDFESNTYNFIQGQKQKINKYLNVTFDGDSSFVTFDIEKISYEPSASQGKITGPPIREWVTYYGIFKNWEDERRIFWFEVDNSFIKAKWKEESSILRLGSNDKSTIIITNDLINNLNGELLIKIHKKLTKEERVISIPLKLKKGTTEYSINIPKETLGGLVTDTKVYVDFLGVKILSDSNPKKTFNIIPNINPDNPILDVLISIEKGDIDITPYLSDDIQLGPKKIEQTNKQSVFVIIFLVLTFIIALKLIKRKRIEINGTQ